MAYQMILETNTHTDADKAIFCCTFHGFLVLDASRRSLYSWICSRIVSICLNTLLPVPIPSVHHFNLGRRVPGFDYGPDAFGTGLTPLHLSDDGEGGAFHFQEPPPPYAAYKYPDIHHPDDPPPPYEASINPDSLLYVDLGRL